MKRIIYLFIVLLMIKCSSVSSTLKDENSNFQIVYSVDKDGLYLYDLKTGTEKKIYSTKLIFLPKKMEFINDSILLAGHQSELQEDKKERLVYSKYMKLVNGDSTFITDNPPYKIYDDYAYLTETFFAININSGRNYKFKTLYYEHINSTKLKIKTSYFNDKGELKKENDTAFFCNSTSFSSGEITFCNSERYYSNSSIVNNKQVFSRRGNLYLTTKNDTTLLLKFDGHFDPKFGSGYYNPTLSPDGKKISYQYIAGFLKSGSAIYEMNIDTKEENKLITDHYFRPVYSPDGLKLLIAKDQRQAKENTWINTIYVLDIEIEKTKKIGNGKEYLWRPK